MRADDDGPVGAPGYRGDDAGLAPGVREGLDARAVRERSGSGDGIVDLAEQPSGGLRAVVGLVVARVEGGEDLEVLVHVGLVELLQHGRDGRVVSHLPGVRHRVLVGGEEGGAQVLGLCNVHEVDSFLRARCLSGYGLHWDHGPSTYPAK